MAVKVLCSTKTKTVVKNGRVKINCFSDENDLGNNNPNIYSVEILSGSTQINGVTGKEGELIICYENEQDNVVELYLGDLIINAENDDSNKYSINIDGNLIYIF